MASNLSQDLTAALESGCWALQAIAAGLPLAAAERTRLAARRAFRLQQRYGIFRS